MARTAKDVLPRRESLSKNWRKYWARKNSRGDSEKAKQARRQTDVPKMLLIRSPHRLVGAFQLLPRLSRTRFRSCGLRDGRTRREWVLSLKHRRRNETKKYHPAQQSPHENY